MAAVALSRKSRAEGQGLRAEKPYAPDIWLSTLSRAEGQGLKKPALQIFSPRPSALSPQPFPSALFPSAQHHDSVHRRALTIRMWQHACGQFAVAVDQVYF